MPHRSTHLPTRWRRALFGAALSTWMVSLPPSAWSANEVAIKTLLDQAQFWLARGRGDRAADAWKKLLQIDPNNAEALSALAQYELDNNRPDAARTYTERLRQTPAGTAAARKLESQATIRTLNPNLLDQARTAARNRRYDDAVRIYRQVLAGKTPAGGLALEYYQTLGGTETGWEEARQGLARLHAEEPNNPAVTLAYAQHLTYRGETRREGIRLLSQLARQPEYTKAATEAWRKGLIWLDASRNDAPLFQAYLNAQPSDAAVKSRLDTLTRVERPATSPSGSTTAGAPSAPPRLDPRVVIIREGFTALESGDLEQASARFNELLRENPNNSDALGGLGVIKLKQEKFADAERLLAQAARAQPGKWNEALNSARFWLEVEQGSQHRAEGRHSQAVASFTRARQIDPTNSVPILALADLAAEEGKLVEAERAYRAVLSKQPKSLDATRGLLNVLAQLGRIDEAARLAENLTDDEREKLGGYGKLKAEQLRRLAMGLMEKSDTFGAMQALEDALLWDPTNPWLRLELARLYQASGAVHEARSVVDGLLLSNPDMPDALYASALMSAEAGDWVASLNYLERIPPASRTKDSTALQRRMWVRAQAERASAMARNGQTGAARQLLRQVETQTGKDVELLGAVAQAYSDAGDDVQALSTIRSVLAQSPRPDPGLRVQYAAILLKTRQDAELASQLRQIYGLALTDLQRADLDKIRIAYALRQFDTQRESRNLAAAYDIIVPLLNERPGDLTLQMGIARLYGSSGDYKEALRWYDNVLQREPDNIDALMGAAGSAVAVQNYTYAEAATNRAAELAPDNPQVLAMLGRLYRAQGRTQLASQTLQRALVAEQANAKVNVSGPLGMRMIDYSLPAAGVGSNGQPVIPFIPPPVPTRPAAPARAVPGTQRPLTSPLGQAAYPGNGVGRYDASPQVEAPVQRSLPGGYEIGIAQAHTQPLRNFAATPASDAARPGQFVPVQYVAPSMGQAPYPGQGAYGAPGQAQFNLPSSAYGGGSLPSAYATPTPPPNAYSGDYGNLPVSSYTTNQTPYAYPATNALQATLGGGPVGPAAGGPSLQPVGPSYEPSPALNAPVYRNALQQQSASGLPSGPVLPVYNPPPTPVVATGTGNGSWLPSLNSSPSYIPTPASQQLRRDIDELRYERSGSLSLGGSWRGRTGDSGMSTLSDFSIPVEGRIPIGDGGHLVLKMTTVVLDAGQVSRTNLNTSQLFGTNAFNNVSTFTSTNRNQHDTGVALAMAYETKSLRVDVGTAPVGFAVSNIVGGISYNEKFGSVALKVDLSRRAVMDSLLSYAGTTDDRTGQRWGGVVATGGRGEIGVEEGGFGVYGYGAFHVLSGRNVVRNNRFEGGAGAYYKLIRDEDQELTIGVNLTAIGYSKNLRYYTFGHGGYFSPQRYFSLSLPVEWSGRSGNLSYKLDGSIGLQSFRENDAPYFPGSSAMQAEWEALAASAAAPTGVSWRSFYPGQTKTGLGFRIGAAAEYRFAPKWLVGGKLSVDNAYSYLQTAGMVYLRYNFEPSTRPLGFPPNSLRITY
jgi:tetratricopeptide (TPR) repeat protein